MIVSREEELAQDNRTSQKITETANDEDANTLVLCLCAQLSRFEALKPSRVLKDMSKNFSCSALLNNDIRKVIRHEPQRKQLKIIVIA
jgi:hypothetical protein